MSQENLLHIALNDFCFVLLKNFKEGASLASIMRILKDHYDIKNKNLYRHLKETSLLQIKEFLASGILYPVHVVSERFERKALLND